jgi:hypothetical protein
MAVGQQLQATHLSQPLALLQLGHAEVYTQEILAQFAQQQDWLLLFQ